MNQQDEERDSKAKTAHAQVDAQHDGTFKAHEVEQETCDEPEVEAKETDMAAPDNSLHAPKNPLAREEEEKQEYYVADAGAAGFLTDFEKRQRRAERFGLDLHVSENERREMRASRFGGKQCNNKGPEDEPAEAVKRKQRAVRFGIGDIESKKKAREERFGQEPKQVNFAESEKRKARAARFGSPSEESGFEPKRNLKSESTGTVASV